MTLLEQFKDKVLNTKGPFNLEEGSWNYSFMRYTNGNAEYIYVNCKFENNDFSDITLKYDLAAIMDNATQIIYVVDEYIFQKSFNEKSAYPDGCVEFSGYVVEINKYLQELLLRDYYDKIKIDINTITDKNIINNKKLEARYVILSGNKKDFPKFNFKFTRNDIAKMICGYSNIDEEASKIFSDNIKMFTYIKLGNKLVEKYIEEKSVVEDWEIKLAESINSVKANYVNVEFDFNGNVAVGKVDPKYIISILVNNDYFSSYNFATYKMGDKLLKELGANSDYYNRSTWLSCKHIVKITYGKKILYEKVSTE